MTRRLRARPALRLAALFSVVGAAAPSRAQEPPPAVEVTVVGGADDLERVRGLAPRLADGSARWLRADKLDPADVLRDRPERDAPAVRAWVDVTVATRARLTFATRSGATGSRFLVRDLDLSGRFDEVDRAALAEVLESSIGALLANEQAGLTRGEAEALLARREPPAPPAAVATAAPGPPEPLSPAREPSPSRWAVGFFYAGQLVADGATLDHGPGLTVSVAAFPAWPLVHETGRGPIVFASAQYRLPFSERDARIGVALRSAGARAGVECGPLVWSRLRVRLGGGADFVHVTPESSDPAAVLAAPHWSTGFIAAAALRANLWRQPHRFWLSATLFADVALNAVRYDATIEGTTSSVYSPWRVRPGFTMELTFF